SMALPLPVVDGFAVSRGIGSMIHQNVRGLNRDIDTAADEDLWEAPTALWVPPTVVRTHDIKSTSTNDTNSSGTGARTVYIEGLDASYAVQSETVALNGTSNVATANDYTMIHFMRVATVGSGGANAGTITATAQTDATVTAQIGIGNNQSLMAIFMVPTSQNAYLTRVWANIAQSSGGNAEVQLWARDGGISTEPWRLHTVLGLVSAGGGGFNYRVDPPIKFTTQHIVKLRASASADNTTVCGGFELIRGATI
ncbi:MAG: hypothetical protein R3330_19095, partial [Saprospiraceae bacterium]|nr:hypothetical protein [Saprospiraceae bacterium]